LTSALGGGKWSASRPGRFAQGKSPCYPFDRRLGGPQSCSGRSGLEENSQPPPEYMRIFVIGKEEVTGG